MAILIRPHHRPHLSALLDEMYRLRHRVFVERLRWQIDTEDGREIDRFDRGQCYHMVALDSRGRVGATARLTPTLEPNVTCDALQEAFGADFPRGPNIIEIARECVNPDLDKEERRAVLNDLRAAEFELFPKEGFTKTLGVVYEPVVLQWIRAGSTVKILAGPHQFEGDTAACYAIQWTADPERPDMPWRMISGGVSRLQDPDVDPSLLTRFQQQRQVA